MSGKRFDIKELDEQNPSLFTELDRHFGDFLQNLSGRQNPELVLASRLVSNGTGSGSICVHIPSIAGRNISDVIGKGKEIAGDFYLYAEDKWLTGLKKSSLVGSPGDFKPLILDDNGNLYLYRYWQYEQRLAENIKARLGYKSGKIDPDILKLGVARLFGSKDDIEQRAASIAAVLSGFCIISGGPGTGKTSTVLKILALLLEQAKAAGEPLKIALAAPTGKAAARLNQTIKNTRHSLSSSDNIMEKIPGESFTIHRLLGSIHGSPYFRYNSDNQLPYDVVAVDESSMADLALMAKLFEAVPVKSKLILLGDKDQLSSVEAGAVLGDICDTGNEHGYTKDFINTLRTISQEDFAGKMGENEPPIADSIMILRKSYRFGYKSGIGELSRAVRNGEADKAIDILRSGHFPDISLTDKISPGTLISFLSGRILAGFSPYLKTDSPEEALDLFSNFTILCAMREGPFGIERINSLVEDVLSKSRLISRDSRWYKGRPVMVIRNDYNTRLFNGDLGIMHESEGGKIRFFISASDGTVRKILPLKLPEHETAFAMTVHKSQGSEFDSVLLLLPDRIGPLLTRELLYTALTRARERVEICGAENILRYMIANPTIRISGLRNALWGN